MLAEDEFAGRAAGWRPRQRRPGLQLTQPPGDVGGGSPVGGRGAGAGQIAGEQAVEGGDYPGHRRQAAGSDLVRVPVATCVAPVVGKVAGQAYQAADQVRAGAALFQGTGSGGGAAADMLRGSSAGWVLSPVAISSRLSFGRGRLPLGPLRAQGFLMVVEILGRQDAAARPGTLGRDAHDQRVRRARDISGCAVRRGDQRGPPGRA